MSFKASILANFMVSISIVSMLAVAGCGADNPGTWPVDQVEAQVMKGANLTEVTLAPSGQAGVITGTGKDATGETFQITVTQDAEAKQIDWQATGDRGSTLEGLYGR